MFELDPFQKEAIREIQQGNSVLVAAPTGAGKTVIAEAAIESALAQNAGVIYTAPIKALSNQKYRDFGGRYGDRVGLLTGDVVINADAPLLIMTTEIYRNSLFEDSERIRKAKWVIFDEVHYLDDPERGTVWEEAILFTPDHIQILALSATVPNVHQLADWIRSIHKRTVTVIEEEHRPVPLHFFFQCQGQILENMKQLRQIGFGNHDQWSLRHRQRHRGMMMPRAKPNRLEPLLAHLRQKERLPALYFAFGRRRTEFLARESISFNFLSPVERTAILKLYDTLLERYNLQAEKTAADLRPLVEQGIAYHHAGMLPTLKEVVEQLFTSRLIKLIFTTETFALGINMPARTVIFDELEKFYGTHFSVLTTRDFYQMAGRAGRRGIDTEGFVYVRLHPQDISFPQVERTLYGKTEPIRSQFNATYATLLNLYRSLGKKLFDVYPQSFHYHQSFERRRQDAYHLLERKLGLLDRMGYVTGSGLTAKGEFASSLFGYELLLAELHEGGLLDELDPVRLNVLLASLVFDPRKNDKLPRLPSKFEKLVRSAVAVSQSIERSERKMRVTPPSKVPHFHLALVMEAWTSGEKFENLGRFTEADDGEIVRSLRMVIQLLRELMFAPRVSERLRATAKQARQFINRDVVDAEQQLRI